MRHSCLCFPTMHLNSPNNEYSTTAIIYFLEFLQLFFCFSTGPIPCMLCVALWESSASHARSSSHLNFFKVELHANGNRGAALVLFPLANLFIALNQHVLLLFSRVSLLSMRSSSVLMCSRLTPWLSLLNNAGGAGTR